MTTTEAIPGHITETVDTTIGVPYKAIFTMTHHIEGHPHIAILQLTQKIAADPDHSLPIGQVKKFCTSLHPVLELQQSLKIGDIPESR